MLTLLQNTILGLLNTIHFTNLTNTMKPSQINETLKILLSTQQPVFLWGPPGVGKSQVIHQTAAEIGLNILDVRAILLDPVDLRGLPKISDDGFSEWCSPAFLPQSGDGILFLDELNAAPPLVQAACYQLILDRKLGEYTLPEGWTIIAAGNRETDRAVTHRMPSALANRFVHLDFSVDHKEWLDWAIESDIAHEIIEFLNFRPQLLHDFQPESNSRAFPTPRSWAFASQFFEKASDSAIFDELLEGTIGKAATIEFLAFLSIYRQLPSIEEILLNPQTVQLPKEPAVLLALCEMVGSAATIELAEILVTVAGRLPDEFSVLLIRESVKHCKELVTSPSFTLWASLHSGVLV